MAKDRQVRDYVNANPSSCRRDAGDFNTLQRGVMWTLHFDRGSNHRQNHTPPNHRSAEHQVAFSIVKRRRAARDAKREPGTISPEYVVAMFSGRLADAFRGARTGVKMPWRESSLCLLIACANVGIAC